MASSGEVEVIDCVVDSVSGSASVKCDDPATEAEIRAQAFTPEEAMAVGCEPMTWDDPSQGSVLLEEAPPEMISTFEPAPAPGARTPDPMVAARVGRAWDTIERWLGAHASATLGRLSFPAKPEHLAMWEQSHARRLPDDLYASYLRHDGAEGNLGDGFQLPLSYGLLGLSDIDYVNESNCETLILEGDPEAADAEHGKWHGSLLAIGDTSDGRELFVEPRTGRVGEAAWDERLRYDGPMGWPSYLALLEALAHSLETGTALRDRYPVVTAKCELRWAEDPADSLPAGCQGS
ncbi:SMI1/KNR4 family protein [Sphaerisporangium sp. NPDC051011]|uniref:SMI1/KNR4 family protein n=1 Tax=Sphaerisporangium sp. NPDC051011 TaxID=3155792 RepID=UPI0033E3EAF2